MHRDIKCSNVLLDATRTVAKVSDFGLAHVIAKVEGTANDLSMTEAISGNQRQSVANDLTMTPTELRAGTQCGTIRYLAPECAPVYLRKKQTQGSSSGGGGGSGSNDSSSSDARVAPSAQGGAERGPTDDDQSDDESTSALLARDVYAWACLLYELLHETTYLSALPSLDSFFKALSGGRPPLNLPRELDECAELIATGWHQEPEQRGSIKAACAVLERLARMANDTFAEAEAAAGRSPRPHPQRERTGTAKVGDDCLSFVEWPAPSWLMRAVSGGVGARSENHAKSDATWAAIERMERPVGVPESESFSYAASAVDSSHQPSTPVTAAGARRVPDIDAMWAAIQRMERPVGVPESESFSYAASVVDSSSS